MYINLKIKFIFILGIFLTYLSPTFTQAQVDTSKFNVSDETKSIGTYSLEDCIKFALSNSETIKKARYQNQISHNTCRYRFEGLTLHNPACCRRRIAGL